MSIFMFFVSTAVSFEGAFSLWVSLRYLNISPGFFQSSRETAKFVTSQTKKQIIAIHILPNISKSKLKQTIKFGQLIEYNMKNIFSQKIISKMYWSNLSLQFLINIVTLLLLIFKLGSHRNNHICRLGPQNLIASDSSPKVRRQSISTNCPHSMLISLLFIRWVFLKFST